jgi:hypothetical protein
VMITAFAGDVEGLLGTADRYADQLTDVNLSTLINR